MTCSLEEKVEMIYILALRMIIFMKHKDDLMRFIQVGMLADSI